MQKWPLHDRALRRLDETVAENDSQKNMEVVLDMSGQLYGCCD